MATQEDIQRFKNDVRGREVNADSTLDEYSRWIRRFEDWWGGGEPNERTLRHFDEYLCEETEFPWKITRPIESEGREWTYAYRTRIKALSALKLWFRVHYNVYIQNEPQNLALGEAGEFDPDLLSREEVSGVIEAAPGACGAKGCKVLLQVAYDAIMRASEVAAARVEDFDLNNGILHVRGKKGSLTADIGLSERTQQMLSHHISEIGDRELLFYNTYGNPWKPSSLCSHFRQKHHEVGMHSFARHSPIAHRLYDGEPLGEVSRRARHKNVATTVQYARIVGVDVPDWAEEEAATA